MPISDQQFDPMTATNEQLRARRDAVVGAFTGGATRCVAARRDRTDPMLAHFAYEEARPLSQVRITLQSVLPLER